MESTVLAARVERGHAEHPRGLRARARLVSADAGGGAVGGGPICVRAGRGGDARSLKSAVVAALVESGIAEHPRALARLVSADAGGGAVGGGPVRVRAGRGGDGAHADIFVVPAPTPTVVHVIGPPGRYAGSRAEVQRTCV